MFRASNEVDREKTRKHFTLETGNWHSECTSHEAFKGLEIAKAWIVRYIGPGVYLYWFKIEPK